MSCVMSVLHAVVTRCRHAAWVDWVIEQWVGDEDSQTGQLSYYRSKELEKARRFRRTTYLGRIALWVGVLIAVLLALPVRIWLKSTGPICWF